MEVLDAQNWTRWRVRSSASFCAKVLFRDRSKTRHMHVNVKTQKRQKKNEITKTTTTPTHYAFRNSELDTRRIFLCEVVVQGRSKPRHLKPSSRQVKPQQNSKKGEALNPPPTPSHTLQPESAATRGKTHLPIHE